MSSPEGFDVFPENDSLGFGQFALPEQLPDDNPVQPAARSDFRLVGDVANGTLGMYRPARDSLGSRHIHLQFDLGGLSSADRADLGDLDGGAWVQPNRYATDQQHPQRTIEGEQ